MTQQHPNTPPLELVQQWADSDESWAYELYIAHQAAQWALQEARMDDLRVASAEASGVELKSQSTPNDCQIGSSDISPPPELVYQWHKEACKDPYGSTFFESKTLKYIAARAAQWGADQELEACCEWLRYDEDAYELVGLRAVYLDHTLYAARRSKPPSLKEQALQALGRFSANAHTTADEMTADFELLRQVVEQLHE